MATLLTNAGRAIITNLVSGLGGTVPRYVSWGTSSTAAAVTDIALGTESPDESRTTGTVTRTTTSVTNDTLQVVGTIVCASNPKTIAESGLQDASSSGNLFIHSVFTGVALAVTDSMTFTYTATW